MKKIELLSPLFDYSILVARLKSIEKVILLKKNNIQNYPNGRLRISMKGKLPQYYYRHESGDKNGQYLHIPNIELVQKLAQKTYDQKIISRLEKESYHLRNLINFYRAKSDDVFLKLTSERQKLVNPVTLPQKKYIENWIEEKMNDVKKNQLIQSDKDFYTEKGERVRSKSEVIIANILNRMEVPYFYEFPVKLKNGVIVHPDFCCLNVRTRKEIYWEHFGMMDKADYAESVVKKIRGYTENGFFEGDNFIYTMETSENQLNTKEIERYVKKWLM